LPSWWGTRGGGAIALLLIVVVGLAGVVVAPWLNLVADRVPAGLPVTRPGPPCPSCDAPRGLRENLATRSWVLSRRRCRRCGEILAIRAPVLEAVAGVSFALAALRLGWSPTLPVILVFFGGLVALAACDLEHHLLPRRIVYPTGAAAGLLLVAASAATGGWRRLGVAAGCGLAAFGLSYLIHAVNPRWLGFGDVRLSALIGVVLGWLGPGSLWVGLVIANLLGLAVMAGLMVTGRAGRSTAFPFGVFLAAGAVAAVLV
jgi:leader peptidase (prepilin peptidase) / N-methyltransferase